MPYIISIFIPQGIYCCTDNCVGAFVKRADSFVMMCFKDDYCESSLRNVQHYLRAREKHYSKRSQGVGVCPISRYINRGMSDE